MPTTKTTPKSVKRTDATGKAKGFTAEEKAAMKERAKELKAEAEKADGESALLAAIAAIQGPERALATRLHAIIKASAPGLASKTWYGMPAYAKDGTIICFFQPAAKFNARYGTLGFNDGAKLDDGDLWPTSYAVKTLTPAVEAKIAKLVKQAAS